MPQNIVSQRDKSLCSFDMGSARVDEQKPFGWVNQQAIRAIYLIAGLVLFVILAAWLYATPANAIPGSTQNPDGSWTGPNGEDLGGGNPPSKPEPRQSHEGEPVGVLRCGCGYVVILRDGQSKAAAKRACERAVPVTKECAK